ncbi:MAG: glycosyltransferase family 39 protein [Blastocatellia bacterium]
MLMTWGLAWAVNDPFFADWDSYDYTAAVIQGTPSSLGLGRALFLAGNRGLWLCAHELFNLAPEQAYSVIKYGVIAQSGFATLGCYALFREVTAKGKAALWATLLVALSPLYVVYSGRGMTEIPGLLMFSWSLWWVLRSLRLGKATTYLFAAFLFGLSANVREFAVFYLPVVGVAGWLYGFRWKRPLLATVVAICGVLAGPVWWAIAWPEYYLPAVRAWYELSARERAHFPVTWRNGQVLVTYAALCSPVIFSLFPTVCCDFLQGMRRERQRLLMGLLATFGFLSAMTLLVNHDLSVNPRYLLTSLPGLAPICGLWMAEQKTINRREIWALSVVLFLTSLTHMWIWLEKEQWPQAYATRAYPERLGLLNDNAVFIVGRRTPLIDFYQKTGVRPRWQTIPFGAGWPDEQLEPAIDGYLQAGRTIYVDFAEPLWERALREHSREAKGLGQIRRQYQLLNVSDTMYQIICRNP